MIPLVDLTRQFQSIQTEILQAIASLIDSGHYILGEKVSELEQKIAEKLHVPHAIGVANGTDALTLTLEAYGIGQGDEVITTPFTFFATAEAISRVGARPVFVDIDPHSYNLDYRQIETKITSATKAIIPVHLFGQPADMAEIKEIARRYHLRVIEDACQAFGATYQGKSVGALGDAACFSFFPTKNLGTIGDGGLITTFDDQLAANLRQLRQHGSRQKYYHERMGYNSRLDELHAAILLIALERLEQWNERRRQLAARYRERLQHQPLFRIQPEAADRTHIYHLFCLETAERDRLRSFLEKRGIQSGVYYPLPLHLQKVYQTLGYRAGNMPHAEKAATSLIAIPLSPFLQETEQDQVIEAMLQFADTAPSGEQR
ncbi:DegT/DnrJ/EryC1/StrS family aminotransferase [Brevibacillus fulvus]|uniref:dTDP-4-amino-4,6-dideoxygalactose transaminase n=1 Tax=Brevibacillus fulvus TaxID=1125967 RepID=A0A939BQZ0_9BACL|nr:DegT/DnrJ/EryC1/StrS family aminotransferase [Brevibacillus fulvus]MBM7589037.1 dTDP-4-amino-4,6-dideoxygalactose transaminase [Brevibacillus fulvus]